MASRWLGVPGESVELREFDEGWVAWPVVAEPAPGVLPDRVGDARVVVERASGRVTSWPPLPVEEIIARSRSAPAGRFPADVEALLRKAGWYPGRSVPDADLDRYAERLHALTADDPPPLRLVDAARQFLAEFGGLAVIPETGLVIQIQPTADDPEVDLVTFLDEDLGQPITPIATVDSGDDPAEVVVSEDGRVFIGDFGGAYLLAEGTDWALTRLIVGHDGRLPQVTENGEIDYTDYNGRAIDPGSTRGPSGAEGADVAE